MPVYNGQRFVAQGIQSILNQQFQDLELIISDNASTDDTFEICRSFAERDPRIRLYRERENRGAGWNHNRVLELATGRYFKWASHDDVCESSMLGKCVAALEENNAAVLAHPRTTIIDETSTPTENYLLELRTDSPDVVTRFHDLVMSYHWCYQIYGVIRKSALDRTGPMGNYVNGDGVLLANLALYGPYHKVPEYLFFSRRHSAQSSQSQPARLHKRRFRLTGRVNGMPPLEWWDPKRRRNVTFPQWRQLAEYLRLVGRAPLGVADRARCSGVILRWVLRDHRRYVKDLVIAADQLLCNVLTSHANPTLKNVGDSL